MITRSMKISKMLNDYPETLEVLLKTSPHFNKLKNKILRKALSSRVNVEQAAAIAGVDLSILLFNLNKSINHISKSQIKQDNENMKEIKIEEMSRDFFANISQAKIIELDVRPILEMGKDPFLDIMAKVKTVGDDEVLLLINSFEPVPLYSVLSKKGFEHKTIKKESAFYIYFFKKQVSANTAANSSNEILREKTSQHDYENIIEIDVRELEPPEPMIKILEILASVDEKTVLVVHHHREPLMLYQKLEERGYMAISNKINENYFKVIITKKTNKE
jgi:uncharacterized protein (DUF2249 family)